MDYRPLLRKIYNSMLATGYWNARIVRMLRQNEIGADANARKLTASIIEQTATYLLTGNY